MERVVWVVDNDKNELLNAQRSINSTGGMKTSVFFSLEAVEKQIDNLVLRQAVNSMPAIILVDYELVSKDNFKEFDRLLNKNTDRVNSIPMLFLIKERNEIVEQNCFNRGAVALIDKPISNVSVSRIEQLVWRFHVARKATVKMEQQALELKYARQIKQLNEQLNKRNELLYKTFGMYFNDEVLSEILDGDRAAAIGGRKCEATILVSDLRGFTAFSQGMSSDLLTDMLNVYFSVMTEVIMSYRGTVIEFLGDGILAVFGAPIREKYHSELAVAAAINMQNRMEEVRAFCKEKGYSLPEMGIGLHTGEIFIGNIGSEKAMRYNIIGSTVNQASRIESFSVGGQVLASEAVIKNISCECITEYFFKVLGKGMDVGLRATSVKEIMGDYCCKLKEVNSKTAIFEEPLNIVINIIEDKKITGQFFEGELFSISGKNAIIRLMSERAVPDYTDVCIKVDKLKCSASYGKVLHGRGNIFEVVFTRLDETLEECMQDCFVSIDDFTIKEITNKQEVDDVFDSCNTNYCLAFISGINEIEIFFKSGNKKIRALEFMDYLTDDFGKIRGEAAYATGIIATSIMKSNIADNDCSSILECLQRQTEKYINEIDWIDPTEYAYSHRDEINSRTRYVKKEIPWAVVSICDYIKEGTRYSIKSLENESGELHTAIANELIMVGKKGEVYCIDKDKFYKTYEIVDKKLDIFEMGLEYIPEIHLEDSDEFYAIDEMAKLCYPKKDNSIIVKQLDRRTKIFNRISGDDYFLGNPGDYMAIREDDFTDIYIIKHEIFEETYEEAE